MFIQESDYITIDPHALEAIQQYDPTRRAAAETAACEEIAGYLRNRYDTERIFAAEGAERNTLILQYACDIAIYNLSATVGRMNEETHKARYERALKWLEGVQSGKIMPNLPTYDLPGNPDSQSPFLWGSMPKNNYDW